MEKIRNNETICRLVANAIGVSEQGMTTPNEMERCAQRYVKAIHAVEASGIKPADYQGDLIRLYSDIKKVCDQTFWQEKQHLLKTKKESPYFVKSLW